MVGGGIIGCSTAYHLAKLGWDDVLLIERDQITSGTTWHAAGLMVTFGSLSETSTEMRKYSKELYSRVLEEETGMSTGFMPVGFIELATDTGYLEEYRRVAALNRKHGVDVQEISPSEVARLFPLCKTDDVLAGFYVEDDGRVNPVDATSALARGARNRGVRFAEGVTLTGVTQAGGRVTGVRTSAGDVACEVVVNAAGMWARQLGEVRARSHDAPRAPRLRRPGAASVPSARQPAHPAPPRRSSRAWRCRTRRPSTTTC